MMYVWVPDPLLLGKRETTEFKDVGTMLASEVLPDGIVIEGHVPAADVLRLLEQRPPVAGLAVPGMPVGSPGMEVGTPQPYSVFAIDRTGRLSEFAVHGN